MSEFRLFKTTSNNIHANDVLIDVYGRAFYLNEYGEMIEYSDDEKRHIIMKCIQKDMSIKQLADIGSRIFHAKKLLMKNGYEVKEIQSD
jgi:hypothetical protein